jgi:nuclease HARBI1
VRTVLLRTVTRLSRPSSCQEFFYNGKEKEHGIKFLAVTTPDGIIRLFNGPGLGKSHDARLLRDSRLLQSLHAFFSNPTWIDGMYHVYGDVAFPLSLYIMRGFKGNLDDAQELFNKEMSSVRISVEWAFGLDTNLWQVC